MVKTVEGSAQKQKARAKPQNLRMRNKTKEKKMHKRSTAAKMTWLNGNEADRMGFGQD